MSNPPELLNFRTIFSVANATRFIQVAESLGVFALLLIVVIAASIIAPGFFTYTNLTNTLITASITAVTGLGMSFAIAMGGFVLSVGSVYVLNEIVVVSLLTLIDPSMSCLGALLIVLLLGL